MFTIIRKTGSNLVAAAIVFLVSGERLASAANGAPDQQNQELETLVKTVEELSHRVGTLEQKLDQIERNQHAAVKAESKSEAHRGPADASTGMQPKQPAASEQPVSTHAPKAVPGGEEAVKPTPRESWSRLKEGMSQAEVRRLLGPPSTIFKLSGQTVWYYYYRDIGTGSVFFYDDGHVASRQKPPFGAWHW